MEQRQGAAIYIALALLLSLLFTRVWCLGVTVEDVECVSEYVLFDGDTVSGDFTVKISDHPGVDFSVTCPSGNIVLNINGTPGDKFEFKSPGTGMYKFCFHNPNPSTPQSVSFNIHVPKDPVFVKIAKLRDALDSVSAEQKYAKERAAPRYHEILRRRNCVRTLAVVECWVIASVSQGQAFYIRSLFNS